MGNILAVQYFCWNFMDDKNSMKVKNNGTKELLSIFKGFSYIPLNEAIFLIEGVVLEFI